MRASTTWTEIRSIEHASAVVRVNGSIADWLADTYRFERPMVVMNAPDASRPGTIGRTIRDDAGLGSSVPLGIYLGKLTFNRGLEEAVAAVAQWPQLHLVQKPG